MRQSLLFILVALSLGTSLRAAEPPISDDFTSSDDSIRRATRGPWKFEEKTAFCTQDDELYKKFKDHGPALWYDVDFTDATVAFSMKPDENVQSFIFTINGSDGHIFRFVSRERGTFIKAFAHEGEPDGSLDREGPPLRPGEWIDVTVTFSGDTAEVKIGDYEKTVSHPAIDHSKTTVGLGFSFGTMAFRNVSVK